MWIKICANTNLEDAQHAAVAGAFVDPNDCPRCGGTGYVARPVDVSGKSEGIAFIRSKCPACAGSGRKDAAPPSAAG